MGGGSKKLKVAFSRLHNKKSFQFEWSGSELVALLWPSVHRRNSIGAWRSWRIEESWSGADPVHWPGGLMSFPHRMLLLCAARSWFQRKRPAQKHTANEQSTNRKETSTKTDHSNNITRIESKSESENICNNFYYHHPTSKGRNLKKLYMI